jgi:hypothetical protein
MATGKSVVIACCRGHGYPLEGVPVEPLPNVKSQGRTL